MKKLLIMKFSPFSFYFLSKRVFLSTLLSNTLSLVCPSLSVGDQV